MSVYIFWPLEDSTSMSPVSTKFWPLVVHNMKYKERFEDPAKKHWLKGTEMETVVSQHTDEKLLDNRANVDSL